jgi:DASH complex subunit DAM1
MVKPPELSQARVNKCLIALVNRKIVRKDASSVGATSSARPTLTNDVSQGRVLYLWIGVPS